RHDASPNVFSLVCGGGIHSFEQRVCERPGFCRTPSRSTCAFSRGPSEQITWMGGLNQLRSVSWERHAWRDPVRIFDSRGFNTPNAMEEEETASKELEFGGRRGPSANQDADSLGPCGLRPLFYPTAPGDLQMQSRA